MKTKAMILVVISVLTLGNLAHATFNSGSTGADGPFNPSANIEVVLPPDGVLNYMTVDIPAGVTVTFKKNAENTPVFILATGDVNILGVINISASDATSTGIGKGGPGGWDGGAGGGQGLTGGKGLGPGGGNPGPPGSGAGGAGFESGGGSYGGVTGGNPYGNDRLLPLVGGSGGGGGGWRQDSSSSYPGGNGGGGGGAITIASSTMINISGTILADGGNGQSKYNQGGGAGSGGAIKLLSNVITGDGVISAIGGVTGYGGWGSAGKIRIEAEQNNRGATTNPPFTFGLPTSVFPPSQPNLSITSIAGTSVPPIPAGAYNQPDMLLESTTTNPVEVVISAENIPVNPPTTVNVWVIPQYGAATSVGAILSGTDQNSTASASVNLSTTYSNIVTAEATFTILQAMYWNGEEIDRVKVATRTGGRSETIYITRSGKEVPAELLAGVYH